MKKQDNVITEKRCNKCKEIKSLDNFSKNKQSKDNLQNKCKLCCGVEKSLWNEKNKEKIQEYNKLWNINNKNSVVDYRNDPEVRKKKIEYSKKYDKENKYKKLKYRKRRYKEDIKYRLGELIRANIYSSLKKNKSKRTQEILSCTIEEFKLYLESKFEPWMTWDNQGKYNGEFNFGWDIDHIIPLSSAKTEEEIYKLNHFTNLQPLCSKINRDIKFNKLNYKK
jgi:hypothetical protein